MEFTEKENREVIFCVWISKEADSSVMCAYENKICGIAMH